MDDLDRTFQRLRRTDFRTLHNSLVRAAKNGHYMIVNPMTFEARLARPYWGICVEHGWTVDEFDFEYIFNDKT